MSESGDKYKIKITNIGIGDPFVLIKGSFETTGSPPDGGSWTSPADTPIDNLQLTIKFSADHQTNPDHYTPMGKVIVGTIGTDLDYYFGLPFDTDGIDPGGTLWICLSATADNGASIYFYGDDQDDSHETFIQSLSHDGTNQTFDIPVYYAWQDT